MMTGRLCPTGVSSRDSFPVDKGLFTFKPLPRRMRREVYFPLGGQLFSCNRQRSYVERGEVEGEGEGEGDGVIGSLRFKLIALSEPPSPATSKYLSIGRRLQGIDRPWKWFWSWDKWILIRAYIAVPVALAIPGLMVIIAGTGPILGEWWWFCVANDVKLGGLGYCQA